MPDPVRVDCLQCSAKLKIEPSLPANGVVMCPSCGQLLNLAAPGRPGAATQQVAPPIRTQTPMRFIMSSPGAAVPSAMEEWDPETSRPRSRKWRWVLLAATLVAGAAAAVGYYLRLKGGW